MGDLGELFHLGIPWWHLVIRAALIYVIFFIGLRLFGKRELGQFTTFDLVLVLLVANALQPAMTGPDSSITGGVIIVATLLIFNRGVAMLRSRWPAFDRLVEPPPTLLVHDGNLVKQNLDKEGLSVDDVEMAASTASTRWATSASPCWKTTGASASSARGARSASAAAAECVFSSVSPW